MLVRNLQKRGDYQKSILAQDENLRLAIQNDQNVAEARKKAKLGIIPEQTRRQNRISEQILTDALEIKVMAMNNLRSIFTEEQANKFLNGDGKVKPLSQEDMEYLNIFWEDLKPQLLAKTGLTLNFFRSIIKKAYAGRRANYGFYTGRTRPTKSLVINTPEELTTTFPRENVLDLAIVRLQKLALLDPTSKLALKEIALLKEFFPKPSGDHKMITTLTPEKQQDYYKRFQQVFEGFEPNMEEWIRVLEMDDKAFAKEVRFLLPDMEGFKDKVKQLYADLMAERKASKPVPVEPAVPVVPETVPIVDEGLAAAEVAAEAPAPAPAPVLTRPKLKAKKPFIVPELPPEPKALVVFEAEPEAVKSPRSEAQDVIALLAGLLPENKILKKRRDSLKKADLAEIVASVDDDLQKDEEKLRLATEARQAKLAALTQVISEDATGTAQANIKLIKAQKRAQKEIQRLEAEALREEKEQERLLKVQETLAQINTLSQVVREEAMDTAQEQVQLIKAQKQAQKQEDFDRARAQLMLDRQRLNSAIKIQSGLRGMKAREELAKLLKEAEAYKRVLEAQRVLQLQQDQARLQADIIKIQAKTRGRIAKDKVARELKLREELAQVIAQLKALEIDAGPSLKAEDDLKPIPPVELMEASFEGLRQRTTLAEQLKQETAKVEAQIVLVQTNLRGMKAREELTRLRAEQAAIKAKQDALQAEQAKAAKQAKIEADREKLRKSTELVLARKAEAETKKAEAKKTRLEAAITKLQAGVRGTITKKKVAQEITKLEEELAQVLMDLERPTMPPSLKAVTLDLKSSPSFKPEEMPFQIDKELSAVSKKTIKEQRQLQKDIAKIQPPTVPPSLGPFNPVLKNQGIEPVEVSFEGVTQLPALAEKLRQETAKVEAQIVLVQTNLRGMKAREELTRLRAEQAAIKAKQDALQAKKAEFLAKEKQRSEEAIQASEKQQADKKAAADAVVALAEKQAKEKEQARVQFEIEKAAYERSQAKKRAKQEREDRQREIGFNQARSAAREAERAALVAKQKKELEEAQAELVRLEAAKAKRELEKQQIEEKLAEEKNQRKRDKLEAARRSIVETIDDLIDKAAAQGEANIAKRQVEEKAQLEMKQFQDERKAMLDDIFQTKGKKKFKDRSYEELKAEYDKVALFIQDYVEAPLPPEKQSKKEGANRIYQRQGQLYDRMIQIEQERDEAVQKAEQEAAARLSGDKRSVMSAFDQKLAAKKEAKAKAEAKAAEEARQEAVRQNPLSLSNFSTRLKKTKQLSAERQKEREETLAYNKRLDQIQREREALEAALDEAEREAEVAALESEVAEREAQVAEREAQIGKPASELEQRAEAETPKRGRPPAPRPRVISKEAREAKAAVRAKVAEQQAKLLKAEAEELRLQEEADETMRRIDAWRQQRILNNKEELKRLVADRKAKDTQRTEAKAVVAKAKKSSPEANFAAATSYRLDEEIAADEKRMETLKEEIDDDEEEQQRREEEQQKRVEEIRAQIVKRAEQRKVALKQADQEESVRRTRGISAEIRRRDEVATRRLAYADQTLAALRGKELQQEAKAQQLVDAKARKAEATALAKAQRDAEKLAASKAKAEAKMKAKTEAKMKAKTEAKESPSVLAFVGQKMSAFNPLKQATKQVGKNLKELMSERMVTFQGQAAEEQPATVLEVALATKEARAEAERERMRQKSQERKRSMSPATALLNKEAAEALIESRRVVTQVKDLTEPQKRYEVAKIKSMLTAIRTNKPVEQITDKKLYEDLQDPMKARARFRKLGLTPEDQANFNFTESDIMPKIGKGIEAKPKTWVNLGKFLMNETLLEQGALSVKTQNGSPIVGFGKKIAVSDNLQAILLDLIETKKLRGLSDLDNDERQMVETLLTKAGLAHGLGVKKIFKPDDDAEKVKRFYMVKGIYDAGNNSIEVKQELRTLIEYFVKTGRLDKRQGMDALTEL